jgi:hypothetical protein
MMKDLKLGLFSVAISASAGIAPTATLGFAESLRLSSRSGECSLRLYQRRCPMPGTTNTGMHSVHPRTVGGREQE